MAYGYALSLLGSPESARDAAQEAFLVAWREIGSVRDPFAFPGWFRRVVHSQCVRLTRRARVRTVPLEAAAMLAATEDGPAQVAEQREFREQIRSAVRELPERERVVTALYYINQHSQGEIAAFLELPLTTVRKRLHTARRRLRERLENVTPERTLPVVQQNLQESRPSRDDRFLREVRLFNATGMGDVETVRTLLAEDPGLARASGKGQWGDRTPLHVAAEKGQTAIAALLLDHGADVAARDQGDNATPLHWAAGGHLETARLLVERGAPVDVTDDMHERGPLGWAVALSDFQPEMAAFLIEQGAPVDIFSAIALRDAGRIRTLAAADPAVLEARMSLCEDYQRPLHFAVTKERVDLIPLLVELGADLNSRTGSGRTPLCVAVEQGKAEAREALEAAGAKVDLATAIALQDHSQVEALLAEALSDEERNIALVFAAKQGSASLVERLLALGAPVDFQAFFEYWIRKIAPLAIAANASNLEAARALLAAGADPNHMDEYPGATALHYTAWNGQLELAELLLQHGARIDTKDGLYDADPLGWAAESKKEAMIDFLLERGAAADITRVAYFGRLEQVRRMLDEDPSQINLVGSYGTALHQAALHGYIEIVRLLLERGADLQIPNRHGDPVLTMVRKARQGLAHPSNLPAHAEIEELLVSHGAKE